MTEKDLDRFIDKVRQLDQLVLSLDSIPGRRELLSSCSDHNEVVKLARSWGYEIGRRWGDSREVSYRGNHDLNLLNELTLVSGDYKKKSIEAGSGWNLHLNSACDFSDSLGAWECSTQNCLIILLKGNLQLRLKEPDQFLELEFGDKFLLSSNRPYRIERTDIDDATSWLSFSWNS